MITEKENVNFWATELLKPENSEGNYVDFWDKRKSQIIMSGGVTSGRLTKYTLKSDLSCKQVAQKIQRGDAD